jgi:beta-phosphoglucomutase
MHQVKCTIIYFKIIIPECYAANLSTKLFGIQINMKIRAILFDMDGVLVDAKEWHYEALNSALSLFGFNISRFDHLTTFEGLPTRKKLEILSIERNLPEGLHSFINKIKQQHTEQIIHTRCKPLFLNEQALSLLKADGYKIAVCSNSIRSTIQLIMRKTGLDPYLDLILSNQDVLNGKPDPEIYQKAISYFGLSPSECLVVEDSEVGIKAALNASAHVLHVAEAKETNITNIRNRIYEIEAG